MHLRITNFPCKKNKKLILLDADLSDDLNLKGFQDCFQPIYSKCYRTRYGFYGRRNSSHELIPVVNSFASFLTARGNEQIYKVS